MNIYYSIILLFILNSCGVGNLEQVVGVPQNLSSYCINQYSSIIDSIYLVPDSLSQYKIEYDFLDIHHYYFKDEPRAIYMADFISGTGIRYIYDFEKGLISQYDDLSKNEENKIIERFMKKIVFPIYKMALEDNLRTDQIFKYKSCHEVIICKEFR